MNNEFLKYKKQGGSGEVTSILIRSLQKTAIPEAVFPPTTSNYGFRKITSDGKVALTYATTTGRPCLVYDISDTNIVTARPSPVPGVMISGADISDDGLIFLGISNTNVAYARRWTGTSWVVCTPPGGIPVFYLMRMSRNGNVAVCPHYVSSPPPARMSIRIWTRDGDSWVLQPDIFFLSNYNTSGYPYSDIQRVNISGDGSLILVEQVSVNVLYIFKKIDNTWVALPYITRYSSAYGTTVGFSGDSFILSDNTSSEYYDISGTTLDLNIYYSSMNTGGFGVLCSLSSDGNLLISSKNVFQKVSDRWKAICKVPSGITLSEISNTGISIGTDGSNVAAILYQMQVVGSRESHRMLLQKSRIIPSSSRYAYFTFEGPDGSTNIVDQIKGLTFDTSLAQGNFKLTTEDSYLGNSCLKISLAPYTGSASLLMPNSKFLNRKLCLEFFLKITSGEFWLEYPLSVERDMWFFYITPDRVRWDMWVSPWSFSLTVRKPVYGWHRVTALCDGNFGYLYIDGVLSGKRFLPTGFYNWELGNMKIQASGSTSGILYMDDLRITLGDQVYIPLDRIPLEAPLSPNGFEAIPFTI